MYEFWADIIQLITTYDHYYILLLKSSLVWPLETPSWWLLHPFFLPLIIFVCFLAFPYHKMF